MNSDTRQDTTILTIKSLMDGVFKMAQHGQVKGSNPSPDELINTHENHRGSNRICAD